MRGAVRGGRIVTRRLVVLTLAVTTLAVGCGSPVAAPPGGSSIGSAPSSATGSPTAGFDRVAAVLGPEVPLPLSPEFSSVGGGSIWYSDSDTGKVARLDLASGTVSAPIVVDDPLDSPYGSPKEIAADATGAWLADPSRHAIDRVDATGTLTRTVVLTTGTGKSSTPIVPFGLELSGGTAWVGDFDQGLVAQVSTTSGRVTRVLHGVPNPEGMALGFGSLWVVQHRDGSIARIDLASWKVTAVVRLPGTGTNSTCGMCVDDVVAGPTALWVPLDLGQGVARIDPTTNTVTGVTPLGLRVENLAVDATSVWVAGWDGSLPCTDTHAVVERLDPATGAPRGRLVVPCAVNPSVVPGSGDVWVGAIDNPVGVRRITTHA